MKNENPFSKRFDLNSNVLIEKGKIIIPSDTTSKLIYLLKLQLNNNIPELLAYSSREFMKSYIKDIMDFQINSNQILLNSLESLMKYIQEVDIHFPLHSTVIIPSKNPYYFYNPLVNKDICYLAQNVLTKTLGINLMNNWSTYNINNTEDFHELNDTLYSVFSYVSESNIKLVYNEGHTEPTSLLGYKIKNNLRFTGLMSEE